MRGPAGTFGTYLLQLANARAADLAVGRLGRMRVEPGYYVYVGSAFGPGGIRARVGHHAKTRGKPHWHIDYLRAVAALQQAWCVYDFRCEHDWAQRLMQCKGATIPLAGFGASDCNCTTHLFRFSQRPGKAQLEKLLNSKLVTLDLC